MAGETASIAPHSGISALPAVSVLQTPLENNSNTAARPSQRPKICYSAAVGVARPWADAEVHMLATKTYKPAGMQSCIPYLLLPAGSASDFIQFMKDAFGAEELSRTPRDKDNIAHAEVKIDDTTLMLSDSPGPERPAQPACHYIYVPDVDATYKQALASGATSEAEPVDQPYGDRGGGVKDKWGNIWWLGTVIAGR
jgi:uncharacterized glyoxalase superfamily protein PhnB